MNRSFQGYLIGIVAAATYGLNPLFALHLYADGLSTGVVLLFRYLLAVPIVAIMIKARGRNFRVNIKQLGALTGLGLLMGFSSLALFESYHCMEASIASTMLFVYPLMTAVLMAVIYRERMGWLTWVCMFMALAGLVLLTKGDASTVSLKGVAWVMASSLSYALYLIWVGRPSVAKLGTLKITFYALLSGMMIFVVQVAVADPLPMFPSSVAQWGNLLGLAVLPTAISLACTNVAIRLIRSTPTAILGVFEPVTAVVIGVCVFHEVISPRQFVGLMLVLLSVSLVIAGKDVAMRLVGARRMLPPRGMLSRRRRSNRK